MISTAQQNLEDGLYRVLNKPEMREAVERFKEQPAVDVASVLTNGLMESEIGKEIRVLEMLHPESTLCAEVAFRNAILRLINEWRQ